MKFKVRIFGGNDCPICELAIIKLQNETELFTYEYIDAFAEETQNFCNEQKVNELPHIQYLDMDDKVFDEYIGIDVLTNLRDICD